ncbi:hypothetical protein MHBO_002857 [Bonamia ostreae]|uniref:Uncharacterized protein n=1 Tax=Bonamia ostreae TaxID=126728 RepID=A0ABV2ANS7_9EUKA
MEQMAKSVFDVDKYSSTTFGQFSKQLVFLSSNVLVFLKIALIFWKKSLKKENLEKAKKVVEVVKRFCEKIDKIIENGQIFVFEKNFDGIDEEFEEFVVLMEKERKKHFIEFKKRYFSVQNLEIDRNNN